MIQNKVDPQLQKKTIGEFQALKTASPPQSAPEGINNNIKKKSQIAGKKSQGASFADILSTINNASQQKLANSDADVSLTSNVHLKDNEPDNILKSKDNIIDRSIGGMVENAYNGSVAIDFENIQERKNKLPVQYEVLKNGLSCLGVSPNGLGNVYLRLSLPFCGLTDVNFLKDYPYLQRLELCGNQLTILENNRYLVQIDLSNNKLTETLNFEKATLVPYNLQDIDLSRNLITSMGDFSRLRFLKRLCLEFNGISKIEGLGNCKYLSHLSLANNNLTNVKNIENLPLRYLDLRKNQISNISGLSTLSRLEHLYLSNNKITTLQSSRTQSFQIELLAPTLHTLHLDANLLGDSEEVGNLQILTLLRDLRLNRNPFCYEGVDFGEYITHQREWSVDTLNALETQNSKCNQHQTSNAPLFDAAQVKKQSQIIDMGVTKGDGVVELENGAEKSNYRLHMTFLLPTITILDGVPLTVEEKVAALNRYAPPLYVVKSLRHACAVQRQMKEFASVKQADDKFRPIVIVGPNGVGKRTLTKKLLEEFPELYGLAIGHTTRKPRHNETQGVNYFFVQRPEFNSMKRNKLFVQTVEMFGNFYGTSFKSIKMIQDLGKKCIMDLELEGLIALQNAGLNPLSIYVAAPSIETLVNRLQLRNNPNTVINTEENQSQYIKHWALQAELYETNSDISFDLKLVNDDLDVAYIKLKSVLVSWFWDEYEEAERNQSI